MLGELNEIVKITDPTSLKADIVAVKNAPVPDAVLHATRESLLHVVDTQVLDATSDF